MLRCKIATTYAKYVCGKKNQKLLVVYLKSLLSKRNKTEQNRIVGCISLRTVKSDFYLNTQR